MRELFMIVVINGSFGVGKTTVAKLLRRSLPGSAIYDPEWAGFVLKRLPKWVKLNGSGSDDYQDIVLWRRSAIAGVRLFRIFTSGPVVVPMAFSRRDYFDEVVGGIEPLDSELWVFCLKASLATVRKRLVERGTRIEGPGTEWIARRIIECVEAHNDPHFGEPVETEGRSARAVVEEIIKRLQQPNGRDGEINEPVKIKAQEFRQAARTLWMEFTFTSLPANRRQACKSSLSRSG